MHPEVAENLLRAVMGRDSDDDLPRQIGILRSLAMYKYDDYQQYAPGRQFIAYLANWLDQFEDSSERQKALRFILERLIFISDLEMRHFVELMARDRVPKMLQRMVSEKLEIPYYSVAAVRNHPEFRRAIRASLFLGMSDGARIDQFRRSNPRLSNEQFAMTYELNESRSDSLVRKLREDLQDESAAFEYVFLVDDFAGSGTTILRQDDEGNLDGRLVRFLHETLPFLNDSTERPCPRIFISLYVATQMAIDHLGCLISSYDSPCWSEGGAPQIIPVTVLEENTRLVHNCSSTDNEVDQAFDELLHKYYDSAVEDEHKGEVLHGYSECGLPLILSHNTPNNSLFLLWEKDKTEPLFPRYERHTSPLEYE